jgi:hypothetical protein
LCQLLLNGFVCATLAGVVPRIGFAYILVPGKLFADSLFFSADEITEQRRKLLRAALDTVQAMRSIDTTQSIIECDATA